MTNIEFMNAGEKEFYLLYKDCPDVREIVQGFYNKQHTVVFGHLPIGKASKLSLAELIHEIDSLNRHVKFKKAMIKNFWDPV